MTQPQPEGSETPPRETQDGASPGGASDGRASALQIGLAREIAGFLATCGHGAGRHLPEEELSGRFGVSRSPVRGALALLAGMGIVEQRANRGFFLAVDAADIDAEGLALPSSLDDAVYDAIARAWFAREIPEQTTEAELRRLAGQGRAVLSRVLRRLAGDGIIAPAPGKGWRLAPSLTTEAAFEASYRFRQAVEPAALLEPGFRLEAERAAAVRRRHEAILSHAPGTWRLKVLVDADLEFHELIGRSSGNQFILTAIQQQNALRRLAEHQANLGSGRLHASCAEHLRILDAIEAADLPAAAARLREHLAISSSHRPEYGRIDPQRG